jgi:hypothetical protein
MGRGNLCAELCTVQCVVARLTFEVNQFQIANGLGGGTREQREATGVSLRISPIESGPTDFVGDDTREQQFGHWFLTTNTGILHEDRERRDLCPSNAREKPLNGYGTVIAIS